MYGRDRGHDREDGNESGNVPTESVYGLSTANGHVHVHYTTANANGR